MKFKNRKWRPLRLRKLRYGKLLLLIIMFAATVFVIRSVVLVVLPSDADAARNAVHQFYSLEQASDFGSSWAMFHPYMQQKFTKSRYIQVRNHIIMEHFGVNTFDFTLSQVKSIGDWSMSLDTPTLSNVYCVSVTQRFHGQTFGSFDLQQEVYATKSEGEWRLLWAYP